MLTECVDDVCNVRIMLNDTVGTKHVANIRNCDILIDKQILIFYADTREFSTHLLRYVDLEAAKDLTVRYDSSTHSFRLRLPFMPRIDQLAEMENDNDGKPRSKFAQPTWKLCNVRQITPSCRLKIDKSKKLVQFENNFSYGYLSKYTGKLKFNVPHDKNDLAEVLGVPEPHITSPSKRRVDREINEMKNFSREQYKLNFAKLQVPAGHDNPVQYVTNFADSALDRTEQQLLNEILNKVPKIEPSHKNNRNEIENGLISILCAICYDMRITSGKPNSQSGWTRSVLSSTLFYFEKIDHTMDVITGFIRRSLIYPPYRRYELAIQCVRDVSTALGFHPSWILKQLLVTYDIFATESCGREVFNHCYIEDYIHYLVHDPSCMFSRLWEVGEQVLNVSYGIDKDMLDMNLIEIEREKYREMIAAAKAVTYTYRPGAYDDLFTSLEDDVKAPNDDGNAPGEHESDAEAVEFDYDYYLSKDTPGNDIAEQDTGSKAIGCIKYKLQ